jgi:uncharacterized RDD family membrane protein YckC
MATDQNHLSSSTSAFAAVKPQQFEPGGIGRRFVAASVDGAAISILKLPLTIATMFAFGLKVALVPDPKGGANLAYIGTSWVISLVFLFFYYGWFNLNKGGTPGKLLMKLRVARADDGTRIGYGRSFAREFTKIIGFALLLIGAFIAIFRKDKRGLHDLICNTKVLHLKD